MLVSFFITAFGDTEQKGVSTKRPTLCRPSCFRFCGLKDVGRARTIVIKYRKRNASYPVAYPDGEGVGHADETKEEEHVDGFQEVTE